jgi:glycosyltransferase involved in cell wall biosynthesis
MSESVAKLRIAAILDEFSYAAFSPDCELLQLYPISPTAQLQKFQPDILVVESAWRGIDGLWQDKLAKGGLDEIRSCLEWCRSNNVPAVFWNKEDPIHFNTFIGLAALFDHVFTTDIDSIPRYMSRLAHQRVSLLPFAAQPKIHNPISIGPRKAAFNFAGSWYLRYPSRQADFRRLVGAVCDIGPVDIFDRNFGSVRKETRFPDEFRPLIKGGLPFADIEKAYKGYTFALNVNTVKRSQSMFARRIFELIACNTLVVSNESKGLRHFFGDLVVASDDPKILKGEVGRLWGDPVRGRKQALMGLRLVLAEHTYQHRLDYVWARVSGKALLRHEPEVLVVAVADSVEAAGRLSENFARQLHKTRRCMVLRRYRVSSPAPAREAIPGLAWFDDETRFLEAVVHAIPDTKGLSVFSADDFYGPQYLSDLLKAMSFSAATIVGKVACYVGRPEGCVLENDGAQYLSAARLSARAALVSNTLITKDWIHDWLREPDRLALNNSNMLAVDEFHYCRNGAKLPEILLLDLVGDLPLLDAGLSLKNDILPAAEGLTALDYRKPEAMEGALVFSPALLGLMSCAVPRGVNIYLDGDVCVIEFSDSDEEWRSIYLAKEFSRSELNLSENNQFRIVADGDVGQLRTVVEFRNAGGEKIGQSVNFAGADNFLILPDDCFALRIALQFCGAGQVRVRSLVFGEMSNPPAVNLRRRASESLCSSDCLIVGRPLLKMANMAFLSADYVTALKLYESAITNYPEIAKHYQINLEMTRSKLGLPSLQLVPMHGDKNVGVRENSTLSLDDLYSEVADYPRSHLQALDTTSHLVSVLMTTHNIEAYVEAAITSVLRQTWRNLEIVVVDDHSTDATWAILQRLQKSEARLRCFRLNTNLGTYFAKNYALTLSRGDFIFFQDGDDLSHPQRVELIMGTLLKEGSICVRGAYSRVIFPSGQVLPVNGLIKRQGLITLGLRREAFDSIGFFNCTSKASDEEFFQRLRVWASANQKTISDLDLPLYYNTMREGSLFADMVVNDPFEDGVVEQRPSPSRLSYVSAFERLHKQLNPSEFRTFFKFPVLRDLIPVEPDMSRLVNPGIPVIASLCSIPERVDSLRQTLASLAPQVDALNIYLDRYDSIPDFVLGCHPRVEVHRSEKYPGLRDNGKFLALSTQQQPCYFFTADDDIIYPPDYVASMIRSIEYYGRRAVVGVHGVLVPEYSEGYFSGYRKVLMFKNGLEADALVNNLGTGTVAFYSGLLRNLTLEHFPSPGMADLHLSVFCKRLGIPMIAVARPDEWLRELPTSGTSLYEEFNNVDSSQSALIQQYHPWGYVAIRQAIKASGLLIGEDDEVRGRLEALLPNLSACLK